MIYVVDAIFNVLTLLVFMKVILSYFMDPYHPIRENLDRFVEPMLAPIRNIMPDTGMMDFSPIVLLILLEVLNSFVIGLLR